MSNNSFQIILKISKFFFRTIIKPDALLYRDSHKPLPIDDVYFSRYFRYKIYPFAEAIQCHREWMHPTMYNAPDSLVNIRVELNMEVGYNIILFKLIF